MEVLLLAAHLDLGVVHSPKPAYRTCEAVPALLELRGVMMNPQQDRRMYQADSPLGHDRYQISRAQLVAQVQRTRVSIQCAYRHTYARFCPSSPYSSGKFPDRLAGGRLTVEAK